MAFAASILIATKAVAIDFLVVLGFAAGFALVFGAVQQAPQAVQATSLTNLLGQFGVDFPQVLG